MEERDQGKRGEERIRGRNKRKRGEEEKRRKEQKRRSEEEKRGEERREDQRRGDTRVRRCVSCPDSWKRTSQFCFHLWGSVRV